MFLLVISSIYAQTGINSKLIPISIHVSPRGSHVYIDNEFMGFGTNYSLSQGRHKVSIRARGYKSIESDLSVSKDTTSFTFTLVQFPAASFTVITEPDNAALYVNGIYSGHTNKTILDAPGEYEIHVEKPGYKSVDTIVTALSRAKNVVMCTLENVLQPADKEEGVPQSESTKCLFSVTPPDASLYIDNYPVAPGSKYLVAGRHGITASKEGYVLFKDTIYINSQKSINHDIVIERRKSLFGFDIEPRDADVVIDKIHYTGKNFAELTPGPHTLEISRKGYFSHTELIELAEGAELLKSYDLKTNGGAVSFYVQPDDAKVIIHGEGIDSLVVTGSNEVPFLIPGRYEVLCSAADYKQYDTIITVIEGSHADVNISLRPTKPMPYKKRDWLYSCIFPGLGQYAQRRLTTAYSAIVLGASACTYYAYRAGKYNSAVNDFTSMNNQYKSNPKDYLKNNARESKNQVDSSRRQHDVALIIWGVVYLSNIIEAYLNRPVFYDYNIAVSPTLQKTGGDVACGLEIRMGF